MSTKRQSLATDDGQEWSLSLLSTPKGFEENVAPFKNGPVGTAQVPGEVHCDLLRLELLQGDPYAGTNDQKFVFFNCSVMFYC